MHAAIIKQHNSVVDSFSMKISADLAESNGSLPIDVQLASSADCPILLSNLRSKNLMVLSYNSESLLSFVSLTSVAAAPCGLWHLGTLWAPGFKE